MDEKHYFDVILKYHDLTGLRKDSRSWRKYFSLFVLCPLALVLYVLVLMNFKYKSGDIFGIVEVFESVSSYGQVLRFDVKTSTENHFQHFLRKITLILFAKEFDDVFKGRTKFWKVDSFEESFTEKLYKKIRFAIIQIKFLWIAASLTLITLVPLPLFLGSISLPNSCWIPFDNQFFYVFVYLLQIVILSELIFMLVSTDGFFLFMCKEIEIQLQLIGRTLKDINIGGSNSVDHEEECFRKLKKCSEHHRFLLKVHHKIGTIFSIFTLLDFFLNIVGTTIEMYLLSTNGSDIIIFSKCVIYGSAVLIQGSISFIPASSIEIEADNLANDIYSVDWYNTPNMKIRKFILFWLMKAQEPLVMSAGGLLQISRNVFLEIPRTSFSIYTLIG